MCIVGTGNALYYGMYEIINNKENERMSKYKYICVNCGTGQDRKYIDAMRKAGFNLQNLACRECGMDAIKTAENGINQ